MRQRRERARRGRALPLVAAVMVALALSTAGTASAAPAWRGAQTHPFGVGHGQSDEDSARELDKLAPAGANTVRMDLHWAGLEPERDRIDDDYQAKADRFIAAANARGIKPIVNLHSTPCWAANDPRKDCDDGAWGSDWHPPNEPARFGEVAAHVANRYEGRIAALELWNEPDLPYFMEIDHMTSSSGDSEARSVRAQQYATMVKAAYPRIKERAPAVRVLVGAIEGTDADFLRLLYERGIAGNYDAISVHPYNGPDSPTSDRPYQDDQYVFRTGVPRIRRIVEENGGSGKLWLTEFGWSTCTDGDYNCLDTNDREAGERKQATYIEEAFEVIDRVPVRRGRHGVRAPEQPRGELPRVRVRVAAPGLLGEAGVRRPQASSDRRGPGRRRWGDGARRRATAGRSTTRPGSSPTGGSERARATPPTIVRAPATAPTRHASISVSRASRAGEPTRPRRSRLRIGW